MAEQPLHVAVLQTLERQVRARREQLLESMANGLAHSDYDVAVGRAREAKVLIEHIEDMLKAARKGEIGDEDDDDPGSD